MATAADIDANAKELYDVLSTMNVNVDKVPAPIRLRVRLLMNLVKDKATYEIFRNEFKARFGDNDGSALAEYVDSVKNSVEEKSGNFEDRTVRLETIKEIVKKLDSLGNARDRIRVLNVSINSTGSNFLTSIKKLFSEMLFRLASARTDYEKNDVIINPEQFEPSWNRSMKAWKKKNPSGDFDDFHAIVMYELLQLSKLDITREKTEREKMIEKIIKNVTSISDDNWEALLMSSSRSMLSGPINIVHENPNATLGSYSDYEINYAFKSSNELIKIVRSFDEISSYDDEALDRTIINLADVASNFGGVPKQTNYILSEFIQNDDHITEAIGRYLIESDAVDVFRRKAHNWARGGGNLVVSALRKLVEYYEIEKKAAAELNNSEFDATWNSIYDSVKKLNKLKWSKEIFDHYFAKIDPIGKADYLPDWYQVIRMIRSTLNPDDTTAKLSAARLWVQAEDNEKARLLQRINDGVDRYIESVKAEQEELRKNSKPEASPDDEFEEYIFADERQGQVPDELDTYDEKALYDELKAHFIANEALSEEEANLIKKLMADGKYSTVLKKPNVKYVYRGMSVNDEYIRRALNMGDNESIPSKGSKVASFTYTPRRGGSSSWTLNHESTHEFMTSNKDFNVLLIARTSDNDGSFVSGPGGLYKVGELGKHDEEQEVVGLGPIKVAKIIWDEFDNYPDVDDQESK